VAKDFLPGQWVLRQKAYWGVWHLVQSDIADAAITKCGRRMKIEASRGKLIVRDRKPIAATCTQCDR
jgi:hypothetical protein